MLILKFCETKKRKRQSIFRKNQNVFQTSGFICNNIVFNVIELNKKNLKKEEVVVLLNKYKGAVLDTADKEANVFLAEYMFDCTPYIKRALLSNISKFLINQKGYCLKIEDDDFRFSSEWVNLARICRKVSLYGIENNDMRNFADYCYNEFGLNVFINDELITNDDCIYINMNKGASQGYAELNGITEKKIYADSEYYNCNDSAIKLMNYGVSREMACAAVQVIPFKKVYVYTD